MPFDSRLVKISLADLKKGIPQKDISLHDSSTFEIELKPGEYQLFVKYPGYKTDTINLTVPMYFSGTLVAVNSALLPEKVFEGKFLSINNILFEFNSSKLSNQAMSTLETLKSILISYPELKVEIAGYTDALGSTEYNRILSDKRAQAAIDYLVTSGTSASRFVKKAYGKSNFVSLNTNRDGSDNPEGRKYNRRVTFGIVDPRTGIIIHQESYAPERLREPYSLIYSIVLLKTTERVSPDYFSELVKDNLFFIRTFRSDTVSMYSLGVFYNRFDALKYLDYARDKGFKDAYIVNQYELKNDSISLSGLEVRKSTSDQSGPREYTIQLKATKNQLDINKVFHGMEGVKERKSNDGFYRYYYGQYKTLSEAKKAVLSIIKMPGLEDSFITELSILLAQ
jgi:outer membrane protein OmpA-like peptidoglycan-associated protein